LIFHSTSKKPIVIAGNGVRLADAVEELHKFYEKTKIPVLTTMNAVDLMQDDCKLGFIGTYGNRIANMIVSQCDLVISIGARLGLRQTGNRRDYFAPEAKLIRADIDPSELSRNIKDDEEKYLTDAKDFIKRLLNEKIPEYGEWNKRCFEAKNILQPFDKELGNRCIEYISSMLPPDPIVAIDIGQNQCWAAQSLNLKGKRGRILIGGSYGSMGCGLPYAIGASLAIDKGKVFCITGDGGLQMNIQELQTVYTENLPIKILVLNNRSLGKISEIQRAKYEGRFSITTKDSGYVAPDFEKIATAYNIKSKTLESYEDLESCKKWLQDDDPCLINIHLPDDTLLLPKMNWNEKEMLPLLNDEVLEKVRNTLSMND
jgi:thiamine pyrophosphate-dependent acetolactate synthase large subunit-like protein